MAVDITAVALRDALRLGATTKETTEATRLLAYATEAISKHLAAAYSDTPAAVCNEAAIRLAGFLFDQPTASRGAAYGNALRNSGAGSILLPWRRHAAGLTGLR